LAPTPVTDGDHVWMRSIHLRSRNGTATGLRISASHMKDAPMSAIDGVLAQELTYGVHVEGNTPPLVIRELCGGGVGLTPAPAPIRCALAADLASPSARPSVLLVDSAPTTRIALINAQSEGGCGVLVNLRHRGPAALTSPLVLLKDSFDEPVLAEAPEGGSAWIVSAATRGGADSIADGQGLHITAIEESRTRRGDETNQWTCRNGARGRRLLASDPKDALSRCAKIPTPGRARDGDADP